MSQPYRLASGGQIERNRPLRFLFNGKALSGYHGDTLASALLANGVHLVARSMKYHRPRGIVAAGVEEPNAIVQVEEGAHTQPNLVATQVELYEGLVACSVNVSPSVDFDLRAVHGWFARLMPPGFFYKTFMWPPGFWRHYEHQIRKAAGFGVIPDAPDPDDYDHMNVHCDVLVIGAGPAGLAAAVEAGRSEARVILLDERSDLGGSLLGSRTQINQAPASEWAAATAAELASMPEVRVLTRTTAVGYYEHNFLLALERCADHLPPGQSQGPRQRLWRIRARQVVLATGAIERPLVFSNNDRPGIMLASGVSEYINRYSVLPGSRAVVFTNNDSAYQTAYDLLDVGASVQVIVDARPPSACTARAQERGLDVINQQVVFNTRGKKRIRGVQLKSLGEDGRTLSGAPCTVDCDLLAISGGWSPTVQLHAQARGKPRYDVEKACFVPSEPVQAETSVGAARGSFDLSACLVEGLEGGAAAAQAAGYGEGAPSQSPPAVDPVAGDPIRPLWVVPSSKPISRAPKAVPGFPDGRHIRRHSDGSARGV